jgi:hypothetical protein
MWEVLGHESSVVEEQWPQWDEEAIEEEKQLIVVQVNGKLRNRIYVSPSASNEEIQEAALTDERIKTFIGGQPVRKVVVVPGRGECGGLAQRECTTSRRDGDTVRERRGDAMRRRHGEVH